MTRRASSLVSSAAAFGLLLSWAAVSAAQTGNLGLVVRDGSIGPALGPGDDGVVQPGNGYNYDITPDLGERMGNNLFHSFELFSSGSGEKIGFSVDSGTQNILSRVTGGDASTLLGQLDSEASLFLLNPFGVIFGQDATVNVNGALYVSTADQVNFEIGDPFLSRETTRPVSLNAASPASFGFLTDTPAGIELRGSRLCGAVGPSCVSDGERLAFVGGDITVTGRNDFNEALEVTGGDIQFVSVAKAGVTVPLDASALDVGAQPGSFGEVRFEDAAVLDVNSGQAVGTGRVVIRGGRFVMKGGSVNAANAGDTDGRADALDVAVTDDVQIGRSDAGSAARIQTFANSDGRAGDVRLAGDQVVVKEGTLVRTQTRGASKGPSVFIDANDIDIVGTGGGANTQIQLRAAGASAADSGDIHFSGKSAGTADLANEIDVTAGAQLSTVAGGDQAAGDIGFAANAITIASGAEVVTQLSGVARGGAITVDAGQTGTAAVRGVGTKITSEARGSETGAAIVVTAGSLVVEDGGSIASSATGAGDGGAIDVTAATVEVKSNGAIISENSGLGTGGAIEVDVTTLARVSDGGQISSTNESDATAGADVRRGGDIAITGPRLEIATGESAANVAQVSAVTSAEGEPGNDEGRGGDLTVDVDELVLTEGGQLSSLTEGSADAGALNVVDAQTVLIDGVVDGGNLPSGIFARSGREQGTAATGDGGLLTIETHDLLVRNGGEVSSSTFGDGAAGNVDIAATGSVRVAGGNGEESLITSRGSRGPGGNIDIDAPLVELTNGGGVSASTNDTGSSGDVTVHADELVIDGEIPAARAGVFAQTNSGSSDAGNSGNILLDVSERTVITNRGIVSVKSRGGGTAGSIAFVGGGAIEVSDGGEISAVSEGFIPPADAPAPPGDDPPDTASDIRIVDASELLVTRGGTITAQTFRNAAGGRIDVTAGNIRIVDGGIVTAESTSGNSDAGAAGRIDLDAQQQLEILASEITTETVAGEGGVIRLRAGDQITIGDATEISTRSTGPGNAGDIRVEDTAKLEIKEGSTMTAETTGTGASGQIIFEKVDDVLVTGGSRITTKSSGEGSGDAGSIVIAANETFRLEDGSEITTTADDAGGGRISIQAGKLVYLLDSKLETTVNGDNDVAGADAGDIDITFRGDEPTETSPETPEFVVINRSTVRANAVATDAGNISIAGQEVLISNDSVIEATSDTGLEGEIQITAPDADVVSQVTPLNTAFVDPGDRLLPPCVARTERTGSFIIQNHAATQPSPDSPLSPGLGTGAGTDAAPFDAGDCPISQEES